MASYVFDHVKKLVGSTGLGIFYVPNEGYKAPDGTYRVALCTNGALTTDNSDKTLWSEISQFEITNDPTYNDVGASAKHLPRMLRPVPYLIIKKRRLSLGGAK